MKKLFLLLGLITSTVVFAANPASEPATVKGKVNVSDFLNVRLGPGLRHPVTGRLLPDQEVDILRIAGNWLELKAPETLKIYVSEARVNFEGKLTGELNMRSRMDVSAPSYGLLPAGTVVKRLQERRNGWIRIAPPAHIKVYVAAICVNFDRTKFGENGLPLTAAQTSDEVKTEPAAKAEVKAEAKAEAKTEVKAEVKAPEIPATPAAAPLKTLSGVIVKWKYAKTPDTALAFLDTPNGKNQAFITGNTAELQKELLALADSGKTIVVRGDFLPAKTPPVFAVSTYSVK